MPTSISECSNFSTTTSKPPRLPKWMTEDDPEKLKDIDAGLKLDESGKEP